MLSIPGQLLEHILHLNVFQGNLSKALNLVCFVFACRTPASEGAHITTVAFECVSSQNGPVFTGAVYWKKLNLLGPDRDQFSALRLNHLCPPRLSPAFTCAVNKQHRVMINERRLVRAFFYVSDSHSSSFVTAPFFAACSYTEAAAIDSFSHPAFNPLQVYYPLMG